MGDGNARPSARSVARNILADWPKRYWDNDFALLGRLEDWQATEFSKQMMAALPAGPLGASEASRLGYLVAVFKTLPVPPDRQAVIDLRARYRRAARTIPDSVERMLKRLEQMAALDLGRPEVVKVRPTLGPVFEPRRGGLAGGGMPPMMIDGGGGYIAEPLPTVLPETPPVIDEAPQVSDEVADRFLRAEFTDRDQSQPFHASHEYTLVCDIGPRDESPSVMVGGPIADDVFHASDDDSLDLTIQVTSLDFDVIGKPERVLILPRTGPSENKVTFRVSPLHSGSGQLIATLHYQGNFITQMLITVPVDQPGDVVFETIGRAIDGSANLEPCDLSLSIHKDGDYYVCTATTAGSTYFETPMKVEVSALTAAAHAAREAMKDVATYEKDGRRVFCDGLDIPPDIEQEALRQLARAGRSLYQQVFDAAGDLGGGGKAVGDWLSTLATDPALQLTVQIVAEDVPIPWSILYLADASAQAELGWNNFLGVRHIIEQLPPQVPHGAVTTGEIDSQPGLSVSLNINPTIDATENFAEVSAHKSFWEDLAHRLPALTLVEHSSRDDVVSALADPSNADRLLYFYCHATSNDEDPQESALVMGRPGDTSTYAYLKDLRNDAGEAIQFTGRPLVILNACESAESSPLFCDGFVQYFARKGACGVIGTECETPARFAIRWADAFVARLLDGARVGQMMLDLRQQFLSGHHNPLGLLYSLHCGADAHVAPPLLTTK